MNPHKKNLISKLLIIFIWSLFIQIPVYSSNPQAWYEDEVIINNGESPFSDKNQSTPEWQSAIYLYNKWIIWGYKDGTFKWKNEVNRAELSKFLILARYGKNFNTSYYTWNLEFQSSLADVKQDEWYAPYVNASNFYNIIDWYSDWNFKPAKTVNTVEFLKMISIAFDLELWIDFSYTDIPNEAWYKKYVWVSEKYHLFPNRSNNKLIPSKKLTRDEIAVAIYKIITKDLNQNETKYIVNNNDKNKSNIDISSEIEIYDTDQISNDLLLEYIEVVLMNKTTKLFSNNVYITPSPKWVSIFWLSWKQLIDLTFPRSKDALKSISLEEYLVKYPSNLWKNDSSLIAHSSLSEENKKVYKTYHNLFLNNLHLILEWPVKDYYLRYFKFSENELEQSVVRYEYLWDLDFSDSSDIYILLLNEDLIKDIEKNKNDLKINKIFNNNVIITDNFISWISDKYHFNFDFKNYEKYKINNNMPIYLQKRLDILERYIQKYPSDL